MFSKYPVVILAVLFLASQVSCEASVKRTVARMTIRLLHRALKHHGTGWRGRQMLAVETEHTEMASPPSADEESFIPQTDVAVKKKAEGSACHWHESTAMCDASQQARAAHLTSDDTFAQFVTQFTVGLSPTRFS